VTRPRFLARASYALVGLGLLQAVGWAGEFSGLRFFSALRGVGLMSVASPLPFVFSSFRRVETFAAVFEVELERADATRVRYEITPELYSRLDGPYNRRNTYGAVFSYGPALTEPGERHLVESVLRYGLCQGGPLARRFGETAPVVKVRAEVRSKTRGGAEPFRLELACSE
jgi:hypothetical protein